MMKYLNKVFGTKNEREIKKLQPLVDRINGMESQVEKLDDAGLARRIAELRTEAENALKNGKLSVEDLKKDDANAILDPMLPEVFAIVRAASMRVLGMRHYDVQMVGGIVLHSGRIAEMRTGEGKTLVATLPAVLNSFMPGGVHVVTVNDYLASRDGEWMGRIYRFLGLTQGTVVAHQPARQKKDAYLSDITYGQNNEFGFDYLRDNMKFSLKDYKQRGHGFAIVDEVDSILIDEARTPLIISGPAEDNSEHFVKANEITPKLRKDEDFTIDEKAKNALLTEAGVEKVERLCSIDNLYDPDNIRTLHHITQSLKAHALYKRDVDYVVENGEVVIVDDHTGRLMYGRRWSDGLHGSIEAKERVKIQNENVTLATVTFQNYFRMYRKLSGMTGTADTEAEEFAKIYDLDTLVIPTNKPIARDDQNDLIYKTEPEKVEAVLEDIIDYHKKGAPILVGTVSVEKSEVLSRGLKKAGIAHETLNAKRHKEEAGIVAQAGRSGRVTIATNMAGRGTDIILGGNSEFMARVAVAKEMHEEGEEQVAEFAFLSGLPELINVQKLAERDKKESKYLEAWAARMAEEEEKKAEQGKDYVRPDDLPEDVGAAREQIYEQRLEHYQKCLDLYAKVLPEYEEECGAEKEKVKDAGGLRVIGTERHESRRIDNQLRGRSGRQGDPGSSRFFMSLEDDLMRIFGSEKMIRMFEALGMKDGEAIEHKMVSKSIENAQKRVEGMHFDSRKNVIEYDDVMNQQRKTVYTQRRAILDCDPVAAAEFNPLLDGEYKEDPEKKEAASLQMREMILDLAEEAIVMAVGTNCPEKTKPEEWKVPEITEELQDLLGVHVDLTSVVMDRDEIMNKCWTEAERFYTSREEDVGSEMMRQVESYFYLQTIDARWKEHLQHMDHLREGIHMRSYGQRDPKQEYKKEGYAMFTAMMSRVRDEVLQRVFKSEIQRAQSEEEVEQLREDRRKKALAEQRQRDAAARANAGRRRVSGGARRVTGATSSTPVPTGAGGSTGLSSHSEDDGLNRAQRRRQKASDKKKKKRMGIR
jgi:preprotein translocase subunit SecA